MMKRQVIIFSFGLASIVLTSGCATRGYVRDRVGELRGEVTQADARLQSSVDQNGRLALAARSTADSARSQIGSVRDLALGRTDFREVSRSRVFFEFDRWDLNDESMAALDAVVEQVRSNPQYVVDVYGFADPTGPDEYNFVLARRRADVVERYLVERTLGQLSRYQSISFGEILPEEEAGEMETAAQRRQVLMVLLERVPAAERQETFTAR